MLNKFKSMIKLRYLIIISFLLLGGCTQEIMIKSAADDNSENLNSNDAVIKGVIRVKLTKEYGDNFIITKSSHTIESGQVAIDNYLKLIGAKSMERVFPYAGEYEKRTRKEGLHLWYDITFDKSTPVSKAVSEARHLPGVEIVEEIYKPAPAPFKLVMANIVGTKAQDNPFNDPFLSAQWHYNNTGAFPKSIAGADINLFKAWEKETGKSNIIVAVVDGGIDVNHEDLKDNMHVNLAELNGVAGVDDDNNGFIDDIYGYNFVARSGTISPDDHGTHVAGTVAARNNNGIGVCGVAGGDGKKESGVRLISCQIFSGEDSRGSSLGIKYGADNGAVISQNSWGYVYPGPGAISASDKAAVDYFIKYAGCDNDGKQLPNSPMKGGIVIFAAGNDDKDYESFPSAYPPIVSVSSMAPDYKKAWYTNRGEWVTMMAPGGDEYYPKGMVLSTVSYNKYAYMQGTSMACPHVSGTAALILSKFGGQGFSNDELKKRLTSSLLLVDINAKNPNYVGRLGIGYLDADKALSVNGNKKPDNIEKVSVEADYTSLGIKWTAVKDQDDGIAGTYKIFISSTTKLSAENLKNTKSLLVNGLGHKAGEEISYSIKGLDLGTHYYCAIIAVDRWGLESSPLFFEGKTKTNNPPILTKKGGDNVRVSGAQIAEVIINVKEPDGQSWKFTTEGTTEGVSVNRDKDIITIKFRAVAAVGKYNFKIIVTDEFNSSTSMNIPFEVYKNQAPKQIKEFQSIYLSSDKTDYSIDLSKYFIDEDGQAIVYTINSFDQNIVGASISGNKLLIKPTNIGSTYIEISASDSELKISATIHIKVVKGNLVYSVYPIPTNNFLNIILSDDVKNASITVRTTLGNSVMQKEVNIKDGDNRAIKLDVSSLSSSTYILYVNSNGETYKQSFIKN